MSQRSLEASYRFLQEALWSAVLCCSYKQQRFIMSHRNVTFIFSLCLVDVFCYVAQGEDGKPGSPGRDGKAGKEVRGGFYQISLPSFLL